MPATCRYRTAHAALDANGREILDLVASDSEYSDKQVSRILKVLAESKGVQIPLVGRDTVNAHRTGSCACIES